MKLKPCPFCGEKPAAIRDDEVYRIFCSNHDCPVSVAITDTDAFRESEWNTRAEEPTEEKTAHWDINVDGYYPFCSHCGEATQHMSRFCPNCGRKMITRGHDDA